MVDPWFNPSFYAWIPGTLLGVAGSLEGTLVGLFLPRGKHRTLVMGLHFLCLLASGGLLITGVIALATGQPWGIWYGFGLPGLVGLVIFGPWTWGIRKLYEQVELRKSMAKDL